MAEKKAASFGKMRRPSFLWIPNAGSMERIARVRDEDFVEFHRFDRNIMEI